MIHLIMISRNKHFLNSLSFPLKIPLPRLYTESQIIHEEKKKKEAIFILKLKSLNCPSRPCAVSMAAS